jgi:hypothetical protein
MKLWQLLKYRGKKVITMPKKKTKGKDKKTCK